MDINRVPNEKKLNLCRWYFRGECRVLIITDCDDKIINEFKFNKFFYLF